MTETRKEIEVGFTDIRPIAAAPVSDAPGVGRVAAFPARFREGRRSAPPVERFRGIPMSLAAALFTALMLLPTAPPRAWAETTVVDQERRVGVLLPVIRGSPRTDWPEICGDVVNVVRLNAEFREKGGTSSQTLAILAKNDYSEIVDELFETIAEDVFHSPMPESDKLGFEATEWRHGLSTAWRDACDEAKIR